MQPAALVRGMGDHLPNSVELLEQSPIRSLQKVITNGFYKAMKGQSQHLKSYLRRVFLRVNLVT